MRHSINIFLSILLLTFGLAACSSDAPMPVEPVIPENDTVWLQLSVAPAGVAPTRSPNGGESGDGYEHGLDSEYAVHDLTIFLYCDDGRGLDGDYPIIWTKYVGETTVEENNPVTPVDRMYAVRVPLSEAEAKLFETYKGEKLRIATIANAGDLTGAPVKTISQLCRSTDTYRSAWRGDDALSADYFVMAPAFNGALRTDMYRRDGLLEASDDEGAGYSATVYLERVAARIDLQVSTSNLDLDNVGLRYNVTGSRNKLMITNVIPVNMMRNNSYLVKQVSAADGEYTEATGLLSSADERVDAKGRPLNYVVTPDFLNKKQGRETALTLEKWYGHSSSQWLRSQNVPTLLGTYPITEEMLSSAYRFEGAAADQRTIVITYANENTHDQKVHLTYKEGGHVSYPSDYLSGLLLRVQYYPDKLYKDGKLTTTVSCTPGKTFYMFRTVDREVGEETNLYFYTKKALEDYVASQPAGSEYETARYPGGICYYSVWIKHANLEDTDENFPMKYGIVRNNIYRISLDFNGIGDPTPVLTPGPYGVRPRVFVRKWNFRPQPEIVM